MTVLAFVLECFRNMLLLKSGFFRKGQCLRLNGDDMHYNCMFDILHPNMCSLRCG